MILILVQIDQLHIRHGSDERYYDNSPENSKIVLNYSEGETERVEGRVRYRGSNIWSPWISSDAPVSSLHIKRLNKSASEILLIDCLFDLQLIVMEQMLLSYKTFSHLSRTGGHP